MGNGKKNLKRRTHSSTAMCATLVWIMFLMTFCVPQKIEGSVGHRVIQNKWYSFPKIQYQCRFDSFWSIMPFCNNFTMARIDKKMISETQGPAVLRGICYSAEEDVSEQHDIYSRNVSTLSKQLKADSPSLFNAKLETWKHKLRLFTQCNGLPLMGDIHIYIERIGNGEEIFLTRVRGLQDKSGQILRPGSSLVF